MNGATEFLLPFLVPLGLVVLSSIIESLTTDGPALTPEEAPIFSVTRFRLVCSHYAKFLHHGYLSLLAFDLTAIVIEAQAQFGGTPGVSFHNKPLGATLLAIAIGVLWHVITYVHAALVVGGFRSSAPGAPRAPLRWLHIPYVTIGLLLAFWIRW